MSAITITHTRTEGTLIEGSRKGDGVYEVLLELRRSGQGNWRYFRSLGQIGLGQSRDSAAKTWQIEKAAEALRAAGHEVTAEIDDSQRRSFAEQEADRYERAEARAEYHLEHAGRAAAASAGAWRAEHGILDMIPPGQPVLIGHHSERRHRRDLERAENHRRRGMAEAERSEYHAGRAAAAEQFRESREDIPRTLRRIAKLEADERSLLRGINGHTAGRRPYIREVPPATGVHLERLTAELASVQDQLTYWRGIVKAAEETGVKVWAAADFKRGDFAKRRYGQWVEVIRVNPKTLTVPAILDNRPVATKDGAQYTWTDPLPYDEVRGHKTAEEMAELLAQAQQQEAATA